MPDRVIIADSSGLIALSNIGELELLHRVYEQVTITPEVESEFGEPLPGWIVVEEVTDKKKISILELEPRYRTKNPLSRLQWICH